MYNRYGSKENFQPIEAPDPKTEPSVQGSPLAFLQRFFNNEKNAGGTGILEKLGMNQMDKGDILLLLVLIYLFRESEDDEWLVILALVLLMGLN